MFLYYNRIARTVIWDIRFNMSKIIAVSLAVIAWASQPHLLFENIWIWGAGDIHCSLFNMRSCHFVRNAFMNVRKRWFPFHNWVLLLLLLLLCVFVNFNYVRQGELKIVAKLWKGAQGPREHKWSQRDHKVTPEVPKGILKASKGSQRDNNFCTPPINRPSGHHV